MKSWLLSLLLVGATDAIGQRSKASHVVPPGTSRLNFWIEDQGMLRVTFPVGEAFSTGLLFNLDFLTKDIAVVSGFPSLYDPEVSSSASQGSITQRTVVTYDAYFNKKDIKGDGWYDTMTLEEVSVAGQGFIFQPNPYWMTPSILGLAPSASSLPEFLDVPLIENLWQQASVFNPIISFAGADLSGGMYLGSINFSLINGPITNYSVLPQSDRWSLGMNGIAVGNSSLGYNGELTVVFNSPYHMMPKPAFNVVRQLLNFTGPTFTQGNVMVASGSCLFGFNPPNITYTVDGKNLTLTPSQYIQTTVNPEVCYLLIAGWAGPAPQGLTYTLGSSIFISGSYAVFNYANATFGLAELDSSPV